MTAVVITNTDIDRNRTPNGQGITNAEIHGTHELCCAGKISGRRAAEFDDDKLASIGNTPVPSAGGGTISGSNAGDMCAMSASVKFGHQRRIGRKRFVDLLSGIDSSTELRCIGRKKRIVIESITIGDGNGSLIP